MVLQLWKLAPRLRALPYPRSRFQVKDPAAFLRIRSLLRLALQDWPGLFLQRLQELTSTRFRNHSTGVRIEAPGSFRIVPKIIGSDEFRSPRRWRLRLRHSLVARACHPQAGSAPPKI